MDEFVKRADQADALLKQLAERVAALEKRGPAASSGAPTPTYAMTPTTKKFLKAEVEAIQSELKRLEGENKQLKAENKNLKAQLKKAGKTGGDKSDKQLEKHVQANLKNVKAMEDVKKHLENFRAEVKEVVAERDALKAQLSKGIPSSMTEDQIGFIKDKLQSLKQKVMDQMGKKEDIAQAVSQTPAQSTGTVMTMETIKERQYYTVTQDIQTLKKLWEEAELGELDDEDFQGYLGRKVYSIDIEEDDDTVNVRFDNHATQWFPVACLYSLEAAPQAVPKPAASSASRMTMETVKERKYYYVTRDLVELKKYWYEAELGELDDEDFEKYLGRKVFAIDIEEDDDTINVRFDNHATQWFPVQCLFNGEPPAAGLDRQNMDSIKERKFYKVTADLEELKTMWYEAELGELDDDDFKKYLGRTVKAIEIEEDDDTINCRFDSQDTQWFPVATLFGPVKGF